MDSTTETLEKNGISKLTVQIYKHYCAGDTQSQIAEETGTTQKTVSKQLQQLRERFPAIMPSFKKAAMLRYNPDMDDGQVKEQF